MDKQHTYAEPAATVIEKCGGVDNVVRVTGKSFSSVSRWRTCKSKGGTGGQIPLDAQLVLVVAALTEGWKLRPRHFVCHLEAAVKQAA